MARLIVAVFAIGSPLAWAWNDCEFPAVDYFAIDEGVGISYTYALAAMNGNMYSGGYSKGNFAFVGVKKEGEEDVSPEACSTLWGQTTSNTQNLYVAEMSAGGKMTKGWHFKGSAIQVGEIGHGPQTNSIDAHSGLHKMMDNKHIAVKGGFKGKLLLPDGTEWSYASRQNTKDQASFVMKLDVSSSQGIGAGTTGWAKEMDLNHPGGATLYSVDGDSAGNMIVSYMGCAQYDPALPGRDAYGRPTVGGGAGCEYYVTKLASANGAEVWKKTVPKALSSCRVIEDGSFFCGFSVSTDEELDFGAGVTLSASSSGALVRFNGNGVAQWARAVTSGSVDDLSVNKDGTFLAVVGSAGRSQPAFVARISTSMGNEGTELWKDYGGVGTHGFRGVEVTADPSQATQEVVAFGQVTGSETLSDTSGAMTTLRSRGSYEVFVAAYNGLDGTGKYAMDGGGTGMEYFFAFAKDPDTNDVYVGGTSRSERIQWGNVERMNPMYNGEPGKNNPDTSSPVGSSKAFAVKLKSATVPPDCLTSCSNNIPVVKDGHCYIDRYCYAHQTASPYAGTECMHCDASSSQSAWSGPIGVGEDYCFMDGQCVANGAAKQVRSGRSMVDSECEMCDPAVASDDYTVKAGWTMAEGSCHKLTWMEEAQAAGWAAPALRFSTCQAANNAGRRLKDGRKPRKPVLQVLDGSSLKPAAASQPVRKKK